MFVIVTQHNKPIIEEELNSAIGAYLMTIEEKENQGNYTLVVYELECRKCDIELEDGILSFPPKSRKRRIEINWNMIEYDENGIIKR